MKKHKASVLIVGAGPVGLVLAHILGQRGVQTLIIESAAVLPDEPRAVGIDGESLRTLQSLDLLAVLDEDLLYGLTGEYLNGDGELLFAIDENQPEPLGYPSLTGFNQPALVGKLAEELNRYPEVSLAYQHTLVDFQQNDHGITANIKIGGGESITVEADYLVGCDGGRSVVRGQLGINMQGESNPRPWLVIDTREDDYDGLRKYRFFCDPKRPGMFVQTPHNNRRWEWMLMPGEDREEFLQDEVVHALISPHIDITKVDIYRRRVYDFHAIIADHFQQGRVFLAGDAAHMTPPFAGQGLNSGLRDATNLGWKLAAVVLRGAPAALLDSYEKERWQHAKELIDMAVTLGAQIQPTDPEAAAMRDAAFADLNQQPDSMNDFVGGIFKALLDRYFVTGSAVGLGEDYLAGRMISQPAVTDCNGRRDLLDEHLGNGLAILGYNCDPEQELGENLAATWRERGAVLVAVGSAGSTQSLLLEADSHLPGDPGPMADAGRLSAAACYYD